MFNKQINVAGVDINLDWKKQLINHTDLWFAHMLRRTGASVPNHIAFCMDGNRRFAKKNELAEGLGHISGFEAMVRILVSCSRLGVKTVSVYAFSIENFNRSEQESEALFGLVRTKLWPMVQNKDSALRQLGWKVRFPGHRSMLEDELIQRINEIEVATSDCDGMMVNICAPYTTRDDLATAMAKCAIGNGIIDYRTYQSARSMAPSEPLDIFVRTSGETRLSDFMAWEIEPGCMVEFVPELWPEFSVWNFYCIIAKWQVFAMLQNYAAKSLSSIAQAPPLVSVSKPKKSPKKTQ